MEEDELNMDPRETDYFDEYDMRAAINFFELKTQLAGLGYVEPEIADRLRNRILNGTDDFKLPHQEHIGPLVLNYSLDIQRCDTYGPLLFDHLDAAIYEPGTDKYFYAIFSPEISRDLVRQVLQKGFEGPFIADDMPDYFDQKKAQAFLIPNNNLSNFLNQEHMNTENLNYLQKQLLNLGFGEKLNQELEKNIKSGKKEFTLTTDQEYNKQNVDYTLHYKAGDQNDMYFFNKYDAALRDKEMQQTFYINKGGGITAKEAYNLMEGRAVHKQLENLEGEKYNAWIIIDKENKTENGNFKLRPFTEGWNYKPERAIDKLAIVGIDEEGAREKLMKSLEKGNRHQVTAMKDGKEVKLYLEANPAEHRVNLTNWKGEAQQLEHYKKPELKNDTNQGQQQAQKQEAAPAKKPRKNKGVKV
ncbi:hypothetical protein [Mucilaginibacter gossypii]|uniref:DUF3945 domain-containing protein n=1 Tax=Mucilaginibacter gossypii TaxID=551996 RepID=A0A1G8CTG2_9SPHI|nr:hypothetical protein [Mucilaginibacter gossypii]SDH48479.1 hypothetical protein SAMN05192573_11030 [Mucilaginibacter gossypii]